MISRPLKTIGRKINTVYGFRLYTYYLNEEFEDLLSKKAIRLSDEEITKYKSLDSETIMGHLLSVDMIDDFVYNFTKNFLSDCFIYNDFTESMSNYLANIFKNNYEYLSCDYIKENVFYKEIDFRNLKDDNFSLKFDYFNDFEFFKYGHPLLSSKYNFFIPHIGYFEEKCKYPVIINKNTEKIYKPITPYKIYEAQPAIDEAFGNVLVIGCNMGYFSYIISNKINVNKITIVEPDKTLFTFFKEKILPQFNNKRKIKLINSDIFSYLEKVEDGEFNYCYIDILDDKSDSNTFFKIENAINKFKKTKVDCYFENEFLLKVTNNVFVEILDAYLQRKNIANENYTDLPRLVWQSQSPIRNLLKNEEIQSAEDINYFLDPFTIKYLIRKNKIIL